MIGTRHYERILTFPAYVVCRKTLMLLALLLGVLPVLLYIIAMTFAATPAGAGPRIQQTAAIVLTIFLAVIALICPLAAAVVNKVFVEKKIGRPPFRFLFSEPGEEEVEQIEPPPGVRTFEQQFNAMSGILFAIGNLSALFGLVLGVLGRSWGYAIPFFLFSLIFSAAIYFMVGNQLFSLLSQHFDLIEGGGKAKVVD
jgi:hypothetical protein